MDRIVAILKGADRRNLMIAPAETNPDQFRIIGYLVSPVAQETAEAGRER
ncbi:hypothetical protein ACSMXM_04975 [Pacificimonas sp. ICDLI1SI03]